LALSRFGESFLRRVRFIHLVNLESLLNMSNFWDLIWLIVSTFIFIAYLLVLFQIVADLFRNTEMSGWAKALWIIGLIFLPMLTAVVYIITNGGDMAKRQLEAVKRARSDTDAYIRHVAGKSPAEQIADAKSLLDAGTITAEEFAQLKAKALS
jgi:hypothetical protein